ncbi:MAG: lysylphosphatidylglycerol synthase transmembrane domain-containing protein [Bacilli bacterium]
MKENSIQNPIYRYKKLIFIFIIVLLTVIVGIANGKDIQKALLEVFEINFLSVVVLIFLLQIHMILDGVLLKVAIDDPHLDHKKAFLINSAGCFFSGITPFYIGSYPSRIYYLYKENIPIDKTLSALTIRGLTYQIVINIFAIASLFFIRGLSDVVGGYVIFLIFGLIYNLGIGSILILISASKRFNNLAVRAIERLALKVSFINKRKEEVLEAIHNYYDNTRRIYKDRKYFLTIFILMIIKTTAFYLIPVVTFIGLGIAIESIWIELFAISTLIAIIASVFPTPGGMASSEAVFLLLYGMLIITDSTLSAGMLIWRLFSYYFIILIGLGATLYLQSKEPKNITFKRGVKK